MEKLYFKNEDESHCYPLSDHLNEAKEEGLAEIELIEAIPNNDNPDYIFCTYWGEVGGRSECTKSTCAYYKSKSGRGACAYSGVPFTYGKKVKFEVK